MAFLSRLLELDLLDLAGSLAVSRVLENWGVSSKLVRLSRLVSSRRPKNVILAKKSR